MNGRQLIKLMEDDGWILKRVKGSHHQMTKAGCRTIPVPVHGNKDIPKGTLNGILKQAGLK